MNSLRHMILLVFFGLFLVACGLEGTPTPTITVAATVINLTPTRFLTPIKPLPTDTTASEPTSTNTAVPLPTTATQPSPTAEPDVTNTAVPVETNIIIDQPDAGTELIVGQEVIINGRAEPIPADDMVVRITVAGNEDVLNEIATVEETGEWSVTAVLPRTITGPADLVVHLASTETGTTTPVMLIADIASEQTSISMTRPEIGDTAVVSHTILFNGHVNNPIDETVTIAVLDNDCTTVAATQSFPVSGGDWIGYTIISAYATAGPACAIAYTGVRSEADGREVRIPIMIVTADDEQTVILQLGNISDIPFRATESTSLFGVAINAPDRAVNIRLETDDPTQPAELITSATAFASQYGFWEIDLEIPEDAKGAALLYITIGSSNTPNYREIRLPVTIQE